MACSKIFSGDLPELTNEIIQHFRNDFSTLYSCILVNRLWCRLAVPLLWEDPFSKHDPKNCHFIEIYLSKSNEDDKAKFNEYGIEYDLLRSNSTLFNYPSFIKYLNYGDTYRSVKEWIDILVDDDDLIEVGELIYKSLLEIFIKNEGILHSFGYAISTLDSYCDDTLELILQNPNFTYNIKDLTLFLHDMSFKITINIIPFLKFFSSNCNSISSINFCYLPSTDNINDLSLIENCISQIIISQHNLKTISFKFNANYNSFLPLKNSNCSNTLSTIIFHYIDFKNILTVLQEVFNQLNVLESVHIFYCRSLNSDFVQQIIKVIKPFKLRSLLMNEILHVESLQLLLQKCGDYLENFKYGYMGKEYEESRPLLLEFIIKYCTKIKRFISDKPDNFNVYLLIENIGRTLNYISIDLDDQDLSQIILQNLGRVLPSKLEYLHLGLLFSTDDFKMFLIDFQNTFVKKFLISDTTQDLYHESILFYTKEYMMKKKRVKYLAIKGSCELVDLKNEVKEFRLYDIIVKKYLDLYINYLQFAK
ncbi:unnamed protein product [Rhizophagus irregularis]|nr:unnamed protein product [Rhizophagus irregularis]